MLLLVVLDLFLIQAWFPPTFSHWNNGGSWSISVEMFFYSLFPLLRDKLLLLQKRGIVLIMAFLYVLILVIGLSILVYGDSGAGIAYSMPIFRLPEFILGMTTFYFAEKIRQANKSLSGTLVLILLMILIIDLALVGSKLPLYLSHDWIAVPFFCTLMVFLYSKETRISKLLSLPVLNLLGKSSYSFYSLQTFFILFSITYREKISTLLPFLLNNHYFGVSLFILLVTVSVLTYKLLEEPIRRKIQAR